MSNWYLLPFFLCWIINAYMGALEAYIQRKTSACKGTWKFCQKEEEFFYFKMNLFYLFDDIIPRLLVDGNLAKYRFSVKIAHLLLVLFTGFLYLFSKKGKFHIYCVYIFASVNPIIAVQLLLSDCILYLWNKFFKKQPSEKDIE